MFATSAGTALDSHNVLRAFRPVATGPDPRDSTPRELCVLLSSNLLRMGRLTQSMTCTAW